MKDTSHIDNVSLLKVATALMQKGTAILLPMGDGHRYDLVFEYANDDCILERAQVKQVGL